MAHRESVVGSRAGSGLAPMTDQRWGRTKALFQAALERPANEPVNRRLLVESSARRQLSHECGRRLSRRSGDSRVGGTLATSIPIRATARRALSYSTTARSIASAQAVNKLTAEERLRRSERTRHLGRQCFVRQCEGVNARPQPAHSIGMGMVANSAELTPGALPCVTRCTLVVI